MQLFLTVKVHLHKHNWHYCDTAIVNASLGYKSLSQAFSKEGIVVEQDSVWEHNIEVYMLPDPPLLQYLLNQ